MILKPGATRRGEENQKAGGGEIKSKATQLYTPLDSTGLYSCNENIMRGAAKSLATPPAAFIINVTGMSGVVNVSILQFNSRHQGDF